MARESKVELYFGSNFMRALGTGSIVNDFEISEEVQINRFFVRTKIDIITGKGIL